MYKFISKTTAPLFVWALALPALAQTAPSINPETSYTKDDLVDTLNTIANWALGLIAIVAVIMILYGGFLYITAAGNEDNLNKGKSIVIYGLIGVVIAILAFAIVSFAASLLA